MISTKKKVLAVSLVLVVIAIMSSGSLAWFNAKDQVTNTFKIATDDNGDIDFSIDLFETDENGDKEDTGLTFEDLLPGSVCDKDPTIKNTGDYNMYARVKVTVDNATALKTAFAKYGITDLSTVFGGYDDSKWTRGEIIENADDDTLTYVYYCNDVLAPDDEATLFTTVTIPGEFVQEDCEGFTEFSLDIAAEAIQSDELPDSVTDAQSAFSTCWDY